MFHKNHQSPFWLKVCCCPVLSDTQLPIAMWTGCDSDDEAPTTTNFTGFLFVVGNADTMGVSGGEVPLARQMVFPRPRRRCEGAIPDCCGASGAGTIKGEAFPIRIWPKSCQEAISPAGEQTYTHP